MEGKGRRKDQRKKNVPRSEKFCPRCGSTDIFFARGLPHLWSIWECRNCGYYGAFIVEDGMMSQKIREKYARIHNTTIKPRGSDWGTNDRIQSTNAKAHAWSDKTSKADTSARYNLK